MDVNPRYIDMMRRAFPLASNVTAEGLLCSGGDLSCERLIAAYSLGLFPWFNDGDPILWWSLNPRCVLPLENFHLPKRSARYIRSKGFTLTWVTKQHTLCIL